MDVFAIPVLAEMDSTVTARKPRSRRSSKTVSMITASISSGRRRFTDLPSFSIRFNIPTPRLPANRRDQLLVIIDATIRCVASPKSAICYEWEIESDLRLQYTDLFIPQPLERSLHHGNHRHPC